MRQVWKKKIQNFAVGHIVSLKENFHWNQWPMARMVGTDADAKNDHVVSHFQLLIRQVVLVR